MADVASIMKASNAAVMRAEARHLPLVDESVDLIVTSPPYFAQRSYKDGGEHFSGQIGDEPTPQEYLASLWDVVAECRRVLKPRGSMFVNLGDKYVADNRGSGSDSKRGVAKHAPAGPAGYPTGGWPKKSLMGLPWRFAIGCVDTLGFILRAEIIWSKPNGLPESARDRAHRTHEHWFHLTKKPRYFADIDSVREPHNDHTLYCADWEQAQGGYERQRINPDRVDKGRPKSNPHPLGKVPGSVWKIASDPLRLPDHIDVDHFAAFPQEWPRRLIVGWCPPAGIVLDPFGGTGTTAMVARALGRFGISLDLGGDYSRLAKWRVFESGQGRKSVDKTNAQAQGMLV